MAGDWIKIEHALPTKPEVMQIADMLEITDDQVVGLLVRFWSWVDANMSPECPVSYGTTERIGRLVSCEKFADAMCEVGWLNVENSRIAIPNYDHHLSQSAKRRGVESKKKKRQREKMSRSGGDKNGTREEKRREENIRTVAKATVCGETPASSPPEPDYADVEPFACDGKQRTWKLPQAKLDEWQRLYPSLDCLAEIRKARQWIEDNPGRRKTAGGMTRFLGNWLARTQNTSTTRRNDGSPNAGKTLRPASPARIRERDWSHLAEPGETPNPAPE